MSEKIYSQQDFDNIVSKAKENIENKLRKNYVERSEYEKVLNDYTTLKNNFRSKEIKDAYLLNGGREAYFNDFMELNKDLFEVENLENALKDKTLKHSWAFAEKQKEEDSEVKKEEEFDLYDYKQWG